MRNKTKVYEVTLLLVDTDRVGEDEARRVLEYTRSPNHCISPRVLSVRTAEVAWSDDHPLNKSGWELAAAALFASTEDKP